MQERSFEGASSAIIPYSETPGMLYFDSGLSRIG